MHIDTREIAAEYRLAHWAQIIRDRMDSGLTVKAFCERAGFHQNNYFYWQRKLREAACEQIVEFSTEDEPSDLPARRFTEVTLLESSQADALHVSTERAVIQVEVAGMRVTANDAYPTAKLTAVLKGLMAPC